MRKLLAFICLMVPFSALAEGGAYAGAQANAGLYSHTASYLKHETTNNVDATDFSERAPTIFVPGLAGGTNPCIVSWSAGVSLGGQSSLPGIGISGGKAYTDDECNVRESLRLAAALTPKTFENQADHEASQAFLRAIACQSKVYAAAMEMTAKEYGAKYGCANVLPEGAEISMRPILDRGQDVVLIEKHRKDGRFQVEYAATDDVFPAGSGFTH